MVSKKSFLRASVFGDRSEHPQELLLLIISFLFRGMLGKPVLMHARLMSRTLHECTAHPVCLHATAL